MEEVIALLPRLSETQKVNFMFCNKLVDQRGFVGDGSDVVKSNFSSFEVSVPI